MAFVLGDGRSPRTTWALTSDPPTIHPHSRASLPRDRALRGGRGWQAALRPELQRAGAGGPAAVPMATGARPRPRPRPQQARLRQAAGHSRRCRGRRAGGGGGGAGGCGFKVGCTEAAGVGGGASRAPPRSSPQGQGTRGEAASERTPPKFCCAQAPGRKVDQS